MIDWSWDLLTDEDRRLLRRLSVFSGGWTVPMAARIVGDDADGMDPLDLEDGLTRLIDRSLVLVDRDTMRYRMLETIRQYAREQLIAAGEAPGLADRHLAVYAALAIESVEPMRGPAIVDWLDRLDAELDNLGTALEWGLEAEPWTAVVMATALLPYWAVRVMSQDNDDRIVAAIEIARARVLGPARRRARGPGARGQLLGEGARLWGMSGRAPVALGWAQDAMRLADASGDAAARGDRHGGPRDRDRLLRTGGSGRYGRAAALRGWRGPCRGDRRLVAPRAGGGVRGRQSRQLRPGWRRSAHAARHRCGTTVRQPVYDRCSVDGAGSDARAPGEDRRRGGRLRRGDRALHGARRRTIRARLAERHGARPAARRASSKRRLRVYRETIGGWVHLGHKGAVANQLENIAYLDTERGRTELAVRLLGAADALREAADARMAFDEEPEYVASLERLRAAMMPAAFEHAWATGRALSQADAVALAAAD